MARQDDIKKLLRQVAPLFLEIAKHAQEAAAELGETEWAREHLVRTAAVNQVLGTARWRIVGDGIVTRQSELPTGVELSTTDEEQNQGRYYLSAPQFAVVLTIRRKPHRSDEESAFLQLQIEGVNELAPIDYGEVIVIYLAVPPLGREPKFELATRGKETISYRLIDLVAVDREEGIEPEVENLPTNRPAAGPVVTSAIEERPDEHREEGGDEPRG